MPSQELKAFEMHKIIKGTLHETIPVTTEFSLTPLGASKTKLISEILNGRIHFREEVLK
jgi:DNA-binding HxlR family transcriptional regulator